MVRAWGAVESYLPDGEPVIGPSSRVDGLAFGFSGAGFRGAEPARPGAHQHPAWSRHPRFGGYKRSENGREYGIEGVEEYLGTKAILGFQPRGPSTGSTAFQVLSEIIAQCAGVKK